MKKKLQDSLSVYSILSGVSPPAFAAGRLNAEAGFKGLKTTRAIE